MTVASTRSLPHGARRHDAQAVLLGVATSLPAVGLDAVARAASLQTRTDHKYLVEPRRLPEVLAAGSWSVLQVDGRPLSTYESVYFDTTDLMLFRAHRQGRRRRYKVRLRRYLDSGTTMLELKAKGRRGATVKTRWRLDSPGCTRSDDPCRRRPCRHDRHLPEVRRLIDGALREQLRPALPPRLDAVLVTRYRRTTFVDLDQGARLTCDVGLRFQGNGRVVHSGNLLLLESKVAGRLGDVDRRLLSLGIRPVRVSKYAVGTALVHPELSANRWNPVLHRYFRV